jgi:hypothetical protein
MGESSSSPHRSDDPIDDPANALYGVPARAGRSLGDLISPDDWRLYHLMRELTDEDRARVISFAELLFNLRESRRWAESSVVGRQSPERNDQI